jgi:nucleotide-binding universal stress UspA family protein
MTSTILVPLDFSEEADRALPIARALADASGHRLEVIVVSGCPPQADSDAGEVAWHARNIRVGVDAIHVDTGEDVPGGILAEADLRNATLCVATHVRGPAADLVMHSVANELIRRDGPIVLVGPRLPPTRRRVANVLACVDGSPSSAGIVPAVAAWATAMDVKARVVEAVRAADAPSAGHSAAEACAALQGAGVDAHWDVVEADHPANGLLLAAAEMDAPLVAIGRRRHRRGVGHPPLGAVARELVRHSPDPVLVVPEPS